MKKDFISLCILLVCFIICACEQEDQSVKTITFDQPESEIFIGETQRLNITISPKGALYESISWKSSNESVATVDEVGFVTGKAAGITIITVTAGGKTASCQITVKTIEVASITLDKTSLKLIEQESATLMATITPNNASNKTITWESSNPEIASVQNGTVTGIMPGQATITATAGNKSDTCIVTVSSRYVPAKSISFVEAPYFIWRGSTETMGATVYPSNTTDNITWTSSNENVVRVDNKGHITGVNEGEATITVQAGSVSASHLVKVEIHVETVTLDVSSIYLEEGDTTTLIPSTAPENAANVTFLWWSDDDSIVQVDEKTGTIKAIKEGKTIIRVQAETTIVIPANFASYASWAVGTECKVTVLKRTVESVTLNKTDITLGKGESTNLIATVKSNNSSYVVTWTSSDENIVQVDQTGKITALNKGEATITAKAGNKTASCKVTVGVSVQSVTLDKTSLSLEKGQSTTLFANITPDDASNKTITWTTSDANVVKVDQTGKITALNKGEATITAKAGNKTASCKVTVIVPVQSIKLDKTSFSLGKGQSMTLVATVTPDDASDKTIKWKSSDENIVQVDQTGKITAVGVGGATVTAQVGDKTATCKVTVIIPIESITLDKQKDTLIVGEETTLAANITPLDATYASTDIKWSSSKTSVATVVDGKVQAVGIGTTTIKVTIGGVSATCEVTVLVDSQNGVSAKYLGGSVSIINGLMQNGSKLNFGVDNYSSETITVVSAQLIDGETQQAGNVMDIGEDINPGNSKAWTITIGAAGIHSPKIRFVYTFKGIEYSCEAEYSAPSIPNFNF